jgi:uncharacterized membrane protein
MSYRAYRILKLITIIILVALTILAIDRGIAWIPIPAGVIAVIIMLFTRQRVKEVVADERNYTIAHHASRFTFQTAAIIMAYVGVTLAALARDGHPELGPYANTLIFSAVGLTVIYIMSYLYYSGKLGGGGLE